MSKLLSGPRPTVPLTAWIVWRKAPPEGFQLLDSHHPGPDEYAHLHDYYYRAASPQCKSIGITPCYSLLRRECLVACTVHPDTPLLAEYRCHAQIDD
jgi:hypothetical protein